MRGFTLKVLKKIGLTLLSECKRIDKDRKNTINKLKENNLLARSDIEDLTRKVSSLKKSLNIHRISSQRLNKDREQRLNAEKLKKWSIAVRKEANNRCDICGTTNELSAHHLYDKSSHPTLAYTVENGVCLCDRHHQDYHKTCKETSCTPVSYLKYKENLFKGTRTLLQLEDEYFLRLSS